MTVSISPAPPSAGFSIVCPVCARWVLPLDGLLHLQIAPRLAQHLFEEHEYEAHIIRLALNHPPAEWPVIDADELAA